MVCSSIIIQLGAFVVLISFTYGYRGLYPVRSTMHRKHSPLYNEVLDWSADAVNMSQEDFMMKDQCLTVDYNDKIIGSASKYDSHRFTQKNPGG